MLVTISKENTAIKPAKENNLFFQYFSKATDYEQLDVDVRAFAKKCADGYGWRVGLFNKPNLKDESVYACSALGLDFDDVPYGPEEPLEYLESIGLPANFYYFSYSQNPALVELPEDGITSVYSNYPIAGHYKPQFNYRIVYLFDEPMDPKTYREVYETLLNDTLAKFKLDPSTKNGQQLFYGSRIGAVVLKEEPISLAEFGWQEVIKRSKECKSNQTIHSGKKGGQIAWEELPVPNAVYVNKGWDKILRGHCKLWDDFCEGYVDYDHRLPLWGNLKFIKYKSHNGCSIIDDILANTTPEVWVGHGFGRDELQKKFRDSKLKPVKIVEYKGERLTVPEFFTKLVEEPNTIIPKDERVTLEELDNYMHTELPQILSRPGFDYFQSQTGSGKTTIVCDWIEHNTNAFEKKIAYVAPTHALCMEVEEKLKNRFLHTPVYRIPPAEYTDRDLERMRVGLRPISKDSIRAQMIHDLFDNKVKEGVFIFPHQTLVRMENISVDEIIIDENIEEALIREIIISPNQLRVLFDYCDAVGKNIINELYQTTQDLEVGDKFDNVFRTLLYHVDENAYVEGTSCDNTYIQGLFDLGRAENLMVVDNRCVRAVVKSSVIEKAIEKNIPIKLLTATPMNQRLKNFYGRDFNVISAPLALNTGKVVQFANYTGARGIRTSEFGMDEKKFMRYSNVLKNVTKGQKLAVLSFKDTEQGWIDSGFLVPQVNGKYIHTGNCAGLDFMKGMDIAVVGKPDLPKNYYRYLWYDIRPEGDKSEATRVRMTIERNGVLQSLFTWEQEALREESLQYIEFKTAQAIGRARALRYDCTVYLLGNYTPMGVDEIYY